VKKVVQVVLARMIMEVEVNVSLCMCGCNAVVQLLLPIYIL
jgi:hypothetical protein